METDTGFSLVLNKMIREGRIEGKGGTVLTPTGLASLNTLLTLRNLAMARNAQRTLEVGLAYGSSCLVFVQSHVDLGHTPAGQHVAMDPFQQDMGDAGLLQAERAGHSAYLTFHREASHQVLPRLLGEGRQPDDICDGQAGFKRLLALC